MAYYIYILTNDFGNVMYNGMTNDLLRRLYEHETESIKSFTQKYKTHKLVYYETYDDPRLAIAREKEIKGWRREKKDKLVKTLNPDWKDLKETLNN